VGLAAVQVPRAAGLRILASAGTEEGRSLVLREGAHVALDHTRLDHMAHAVEAAGPGGINVILEMLANVNLDADLKAVARAGRIVVIGSRGPVEITPRDAMGRDAAILGMSLFNASPADLVEIHAALGPGLSNGSLRPVVGLELPLAAAGEAQRRVLEGPAQGNIVLTM